MKRPPMMQLLLPLAKAHPVELPDEPAQDLVRVLTELLLCVAQSYSAGKESSHERPE